MPVGQEEGSRAYIDVLQGNFQRNCDFLSNKYLFDLVFDRSILEGRPTSWVPFVAGGRPLIGDGVSSAMDPVHLVLLGFLTKASFLCRLEIEKLVYFSLGLIFLLWISRLFGFRWPVGLAIALIYYTSYYPLGGHSEYMFFLPAAVVAALIFAWEKSRRNALICRWAILSLSMALSWYVLLSDFPAICALIVAGWLVANFVFPPPQSVRKKFFLHESLLFAAVFGTAALLSLPKFLPLFRYLQETTRYNSYQCQEISFSVPFFLSQLKSFLPRFLFITFPPGAFIAALALVFPAPSRELKKLKFFSISLLISGFLFHCGAFNPLIILFKWNTKLSQFWPLMTLATMGFIIGGLRILVSPPGSKFWFRAASALIISCFIVSLLGRPLLKPSFYAESFGGILVLALMLGASFLFGPSKKSDPKPANVSSLPQEVVGAVTILLVIVSVSGSGLTRIFSWYPATKYFYHPLYPDQPTLRFNDPLPEKYRTHYLEPEIKDCGNLFRITGFVPDVKSIFFGGFLYPNHSCVWRYFDAGGIYSLFSKNYSELVARINQDCPDEDGKRLNSKVPPIISKLDPLLRYLSLKYLISAIPLDSPLIELKRKVVAPVTYDYWINPQSLFKTLYVYALKRPIPRFFSPTKIVRVRSQDVLTAMSELSGEEFPVVLARSEFYQLNDSVRSIPPLQYALVRDDLDRLMFEIRANKESYLIINDNFLPGWKAWLDGKRIPIEKANYAFMAMRIPPGTHRLTVKYRPAGLSAGLFIAGLTFSATIISLFLERRRRKKKGSQLPCFP